MNYIRRILVVVLFCFAINISKSNDNFNKFNLSGIQLGEVKGECTMNLCDSYMLEGSSKLIYSSCCQFMVINGRKEYLKNNSQSSPTTVELENANYIVIINYTKLNCNGKVCCDMKGEMTITNKRSDEIKEFKVYGSVNCE